jgi:hypothetical protein
MSSSAAFSVAATGNGSTADIIDAINVIYVRGGGGCCTLVYAAPAAAGGGRLYAALVELTLTAAPLWSADHPSTCLSARPRSMRPPAAFTRLQDQTFTANVTVGYYDESLNDMDTTLRKLTNSPVRGPVVLAAAVVARGERVAGRAWFPNTR